MSIIYLREISGNGDKSMNYKRSVYRTLTLVSQLGISIVVPVLLCTFLGSWLEDKFHLPLFIPLVVLGVLAGLRNAYILVVHANEDPDDKKKRY